jgi:hypothetical protein
VIFFYPAGLDHLAQRNLHAATVQRRGGTARALEAGMAVGKQQHRVTVHRPEAAQHINVVLEIITDASDGTGISLNGFRLKALEMLQVLFVIALEFSLVR